MQNIIKDCKRKPKINSENRKPKKKCVSNSSDYLISYLATGHILYLLLFSLILKTLWEDFSLNISIPSFRKSSIQASQKAGIFFYYVLYVSATAGGNPDHMLTKGKS